MNSLVTADSVSRRFVEVVAVDDVSLEVRPGEIVGLLGANGAGKTTLLRLLLGLVGPTSGRVALFGRRPDREGRRRLGYMPQGLGLYEDLTVTENLRFTARVHRRPAPAVDDLAVVADVPIAKLSLGARRRVAFAAATLHRPDLLVLDEPTSGVGPLSRAQLWDTIHTAADRGVGVLVTTHYMDEAEQCDRLIVMARGRQVAAGTVAEVIGDIHTVQVEAPDVPAALDRLEAAGLIAVPAGHRLRVPGADQARVAAALGDGDEIRTTLTPANLEEAFIALAGS